MTCRIALETDDSSLTLLLETSRGWLSVATLSGEIFEPLNDAAPAWLLEEASERLATGELGADPLEVGEPEGPVLAAEVTTPWAFGRSSEAPVYA